MPPRAREGKGFSLGGADKDVMGTALTAAGIKLSLLQRGYLPREQAAPRRALWAPVEAELGTVRGGTALVRAFYFARCLAVEAGIRKLLSEFSAGAAPIGGATLLNVIFLGGGLDPLGVALAREMDGLHVCELDLPQIVDAKRRAFGGGGADPRPGSTWEAHAVDLRSAAAVASFLASGAAALPPAAPTVLVSECCLAYIEGAAGVLAAFCERFPRLSLVQFEPCGDDSALWRSILRSFGERSVPLHGCGGGPAARAATAREAGFRDVAAWTLGMAIRELGLAGAFHRAFGASETDGSFSFAGDPFDEHAALNAALRGYGIIIARSAVCNSAAEAATRPLVLRSGYRVRPCRREEVGAARDLAALVYGAYADDAAVARFLRRNVQRDFDEPCCFFRVPFPGLWNYLAVAEAIPTGAILGCAGVVFREPGVAELKHVAVDAAARRRGIGRGMVERLVAYSAAMLSPRGGGTLRLSTIPRMAEAQRLYESLGFAREDRKGPYPQFYMPLPAAAADGSTGAKGESERRR